MDFVVRWAWRSNGVLTDTERLSAIKYYPPIKARAESQLAALQQKEG